MKTAAALLDLGFDINDGAFVEGSWKATPLWCAIGRGRNLALARYLLLRGSTPNYCLFAAVFNHDLAAIRLLVAHGAEVDEDFGGATPFLEAIGWSRFEAAELLLEFGANPNRIDNKGSTALHLMLKKGSDPRHFRNLISRGARGDIADARGQTVIAALKRKKDPAFRSLVSEFERAAGCGLSSRRKPG